MARKKQVDVNTSYKVLCPKCHNYREKEEMCYGFSYTSCVYCAAYQRITANNTVYIPRKMREKLGIKNGDAVEVKVEGDRIVIQKANRLEEEKFKEEYESEEIKDD